MTKQEWYKNLEVKIKNLEIEMSAVVDENERLKAQIDKLIDILHRCDYENTCRQQVDT